MAGKTDKGQYGVFIDTPPEQQHRFQIAGHNNVHASGQSPQNNRDRDTLAIPAMIIFWIGIVSMMLIFLASSAGQVFSVISFLCFLTTSIFLCIFCCNGCGYKRPSDKYLRDNSCACPGLTRSYGIAGSVCLCIYSSFIIYALL